MMYGGDSKALINLHMGLLPTQDLAAFWIDRLGTICILSPGSLKSDLPTDICICRCVLRGKSEEELTKLGKLVPVHAVDLAELEVAGS